MARGFDLSSNNLTAQGTFDYSVLLSVLKTYAHPFVIIKNGQGAGYQFDKYKSLVAQFEADGIPVATYFWPTNAPIEDQITNCKNNLVTKLLMYDLEDIQEYFGGNVTSARTVIQSLVSAFSATNTQLLYSNISTLALVYPEHDFPCELWLANPSNDPVPYGTTITQGTQVTIEGIGLLDTDEMSDENYARLFGLPVTPIATTTTTTTAKTTSAMETQLYLKQFVLSTDASGDGWLAIDIADNSIVSVTAHGSYPPVDGYWPLPRLGHQQRTLPGAQSVIEVQGASPNATITVYVCYVA